VRFFQHRNFIGLDNRLLPAFVGKSLEAFKSR
jgi:hypothetical protein